MGLTAYTYNPHKHTKIWLSNNPELFLNLENQVRLLEMREKNSNDEINLVYDATLLTQAAITRLKSFCKENRITPIDVDSFNTLELSEKERTLFKFYKDEIYNCKEGGNLAVASDILRWLSPVYKTGTYTDFDFPVVTNELPRSVKTQAPLLLNLGSLKLGKQEFLFSNNDYVAVVDYEAAKKQLEEIQQGIIDKLTHYDTDFLERTEAQLHDTFFNRLMLRFMKNRAESFYIAKSKELCKSPTSSRQTRNYIQKIMSDKNLFLNFTRKSPDENNDQVLNRLKKELYNSLNVVKYLFFGEEYTAIKHILKQNDDAILAYLMQKELNLYLKSIVVCTTGPIQIAKSLFNGYVVNLHDFYKNVEPISFNHYNLQKAFKTPNSIPLHTNPWEMLNFLGENEGELNDSSWLESGRRLQEKRIKKLELRQQELSGSLSESIKQVKINFENDFINLSNTQSGIFFQHRKKFNETILQTVLDCFHQNEFDIAQFQSSLDEYPDFDRLIYKQIKKSIEDLKKLCHEAVVFSLTRDRKITLS